jgi:POT family proton-dependent oligopeptide transporter
MQMMGTWFMGAAVGNLIAGRVGGMIGSLPLPSLFGTVAAIAVGAGLLFWLFSKPIKRMCQGLN